MSHRRVGAPQRYAGDQNSLHRCAIALCSNPAIAEGLCEVHGRRPGDMPVNRTGGYMPNGAQYMPQGAPGYGNETPDRYRSSPNVAMQPQARATKKQKPNPEAGRHPMMGMPSMGGSRPMGKNYPSLTQESLNQMVSHGKYSKGPTSMSTYDDSPYLQGHRPAQSSTTGSVLSDSESNGEGGDRETNLRRERNRIAARKSRQRKLDRISNLEEEKMRLEQHRDMLVQEIRSLEKKDSNVSSNTVMTITDKEYAQLQSARINIIKAVEEAYNSGDIFATMQYLRDDSIVSGPQNSSVHLRGKDALVLDYLCTTYLFSDIDHQHVKVDSGGPRSQHFRVHWVFSGIVKSAGVSMNKEFLELIESVKGKRVQIEGVSNFSFSGDKIVYVHRTADQAKFLSALVNLSKQ
ncbi:hypothetical protein Poli38472_005922 [Pythium oligandrum]|uniref:BZIP domain-containing protein n=1 Tax=Pythium oligandrum TaxID=41045 RepID=A0A8K1CRX1_PYTOL|nr:hypothetical protein Poli38472_005922 [Pythium oligandrum]|eukprot:TMW68454.1 hypothetical protein Poli38472_005922 [Pythium oligandrum]